VFWTDWDRHKPRIESSNMDGSGRLALAESNLGSPNALTADAQAYEVCWTDAGSQRAKVSPKIGKTELMKAFDYCL